MTKINDIAYILLDYPVGALGFCASVNIASVMNSLFVCSSESEKYK